MEMQSKNISGEGYYSMSSVNPSSSYAKNSSLQKSVNDAAKFLIHEAVTNNFELENISTQTICIADVGCSIGPNTFSVVQDIIEAMEQYSISDTHEYQVFFNDILTNDFNTLFQSLPIKRKYHAAGVPGSFHSRLFPKASLHFVHSSFALQWLSRVPKEVTDKSSSCWNRGNIFYSHSGEEVARAYSNQFEKDFNSFLAARAQEIVHGGLVAITIPARSNGVPHSKVSFNMNYNFLGLCLLDLVNMGVVEKEKLDSFNIPVYHPSIEELETAVERNGYFHLVKREILPFKPQLDNQLPEVMISRCMRALQEGPIISHFGDHIVDQLFDLYTKKIGEGYHQIAESDVLHAFVLLKRKSSD